MLLTEQFTFNFPLHPFSLAVNALRILSQSLLSYPLAYNLFNYVIHYFPIMSRKGHLFLIKYNNLSLIYLMFSISQKIKKTFKVSITKQVLLTLYLFIKQKLCCKEEKKRLPLLKCYAKEII